MPVGTAQPTPPTGAPVAEQPATPPSTQASTDAAQPQPTPDVKQPDVKQPADQASAIAGAAKPLTAAAAPTQVSTPTVVSPTSVQTAQPGTGSHTGTGSQSHADTGGQAAAGSAGAASAGTAGGTQAGELFSVESAAQARNSQSSGPSLPQGVVHTSVSLQDAVDAVRATFTAANQAGVSSARISLSPASLGGIKISLSQTPDGLIARVATDHPEAAQTLQQSAGDLKRSLEASGMSLLRLDIGSSGQQSLSGFSGSDQEGSAPGSQASAGEPEAVDGDETSNPTELTIELSSGSLVNVLA
jgi:flagellar hook-length control protein FliK